FAVWFGRSGALSLRSRMVEWSTKPVNGTSIFQRRAGDQVAPPRPTEHSCRALREIARETKSGAVTPPLPPVATRLGKISRKVLQPRSLALNSFAWNSRALLTWNFAQLQERIGGAGRNRTWGV